jgi:cytochrome c5
MNRRLFTAIFLPCCLIAFLFCAAQEAQPQSRGKSSVHAAKPASGATSEGERRFRTNCGRCHNPPEDISPREARAVIRQMRVRAMLSAEDERLILQYLAP